MASSYRKEAGFARFVQETIHHQSHLVETLQLNEHLWISLVESRRARLQTAALTSYNLVTARPIHLQSFGGLFRNAIQIQSKSSACSGIPSDLTGRWIMDETELNMVERSHSGSWIGQEIRSERLAAGLVAGFLIGVTEVAFSISYGSLIFSGDLAEYLPYGIGMALVTAIIVMATVSLASRIPAIIGTSQESSAIILGVIAASLAATLVDTPPDQKLTTILVAIAFATLLTGTFCFAVGFFGLGRLVRFIPYPVVGGFLAGTGWLLVTGSIIVMTGNQLSWESLPALFSPVELVTWLPGLLFALILFFSLKRFHNILLLPGLLLAFIAVTYLVLFLTDTSIEQAITAGILLGQDLGRVAWEPLSLANLASADWWAIFRQGGNLAIVVVLSGINLLLNVTALELEHQKDIDLNHELKSAGIANLLSGLGGGMVGYHTLSMSSLSYRIKARGRLPGLIAAAICTFVFIFIPGLLAYIPIPVLGGILMFLGLEFLADWVVAGWSRLARPDYIIVIIIMAVIAMFNFLVGVAVGLLAMIILFVLSYSQVNVVHHALSGAEITSSVERNHSQRRLLAETLGQHIYILELQGFIFFGTANAVLERIKSYLETAHLHAVNFILLDFRRVTGLDSSAVFSFKKALQLSETKTFILVLTGISEKIRQQLSRSDLFADPTRVLTFRDLDHGLENCENELLRRHDMENMNMVISISQQLAAGGFKHADPDRILNYLESLQVKRGERLIQQGDPADSLYFIEDGTLSVQLEMGEGKQVRLKTLSSGTAVGEIGFYLDVPRTASVVADTPAVVYRLSRVALEKMREMEPELALAFHEYMARMLSERLQTTTRTLEASLR